MRADQLGSRFASASPNALEAMWIRSITTQARTSTTVSIRLGIRGDGATSPLLETAITLGTEAQPVSTVRDIVRIVSSESRRKRRRGPSGPQDQSAKTTGSGRRGERGRR